MPDTSPDIDDLAFHLALERQRSAELAETVIGLQAVNRDLRRQIGPLRAELKKLNAERRDTTAFADMPSQAEWRERQQRGVVRFVEGDVELHRVR